VAARATMSALMGTPHLRNERYHINTIDGRSERSERLKRCADRIDQQKVPWTGGAICLFRLILQPGILIMTR
jgi:hypothetical protein